MYPFLFMYVYILLLAVLCLCCYVGFSLAEASGGCSVITVPGLLFVVTSLAAEHVL